MCLEAIAEKDSVEQIAWNEKETLTRWNGRDFLNALHHTHQEARISSVALQRARFNTDQTGYILCRVERYSSDDSVGLPTRSIRDDHSTSSSKHSNNNSDSRPSRSIRDYHSTSSSKHSHDKTSESDSDVDESEEKEDSKFDMKQSISAKGKYDRDNHGYSSNQARLRYENSMRFKNGHSLDIGASVSYERHVDRAELNDRTSGEIDASYNF